MTSDINAKHGAEDWRLRKADFTSLDVLVQPDEYFLARLPATFPIPPLVMDMLQMAPRSSQPLFCSITRTHKELSILVSASESGRFSKQELEAELKPDASNANDNQFGIDGPWAAFRIRGPMEFHLVGVMAEFSKALDAQAISLFAVSTWDTDYICVKAEQAENAKQALKGDGWNVVEHA